VFQTLEEPWKNIPPLPVRAQIRAYFALARRRCSGFAAEAEKDFLIPPERDQEADHEYTTYFIAINEMRA